MNNFVVVMLLGLFFIGCEDGANCLASCNSNLASKDLTSQEFNKTLLECASICNKASVFKTDATKETTAE